MINAFGNPDGSCVQIEDMMHGFIEINEQFFMSGTEIPNYVNKRVIVGAKGAGKTVYLRRMQAKLIQNDSVMACDIGFEVPATDLVIRFGNQFQKDILTEKWSDIWKLAILRALISHIVTENEWSKSAPQMLVTQLEQYADTLYPNYKVPMSVYGELKDILSSYITKNQYNEYSTQRSWEEVEAIIKRILKYLKPIYFFLDAVDEEYGNAPTYWMECQKGLFNRVMRFVQEGDLSNRLFVIISIRDNVWSSIYSEHPTQYHNAEHIQILKWDYRSIEYFFNSKIKTLEKKYIKNTVQDVQISDWLGISMVQNVYRNISEPVMQYILRHTRLLPRDVIIVGNVLATIRKYVYDMSEFGSEEVQKFVRGSIADCAKIFGSELLEICANQIISQIKAENYNARIYSSDIEYEVSVSQKLKEIICQLQHDKFSWKKLCDLQANFDTIFGKKIKILDILWQNGAIGYLETGASREQREIFFDIQYPEFKIPQNKTKYILRSCLIDACDIEQEQEWDQRPVLGDGKR